MRNAILSILLFIVIMFVVFFFNKSVLTLCDNIQATTDEISLLLENNDFENSYTLSLELLNSIESKHAITSTYLNHSDFDDLVNESVKLSLYILNEDIIEAQTSLNLVKYNTRHIKALQIPSIENIF